ncbi:biotin--[acetyl-CoA-carboxylase] ligase [Candidatus Bipolaricaulota bacterium]|nr:biotin--[acetyl-CoA-carboxylase] ligase [Candidatus Bipolaricaulota bacterium]
MVLLHLAEGLEPWPILEEKTGLPREALKAELLQLKAEGFPVRIEEEGAGLEPGTPAPQILLPLLRGRLGRPYRYLGLVPSTQDVLRGWRDAPCGALVLAERQTFGRGRHGRRWESPPGNLYFSVLLEDTDNLLPLRAGLALAEAAEVGVLKWPNDLLAPDGRKLAGILVEAQGKRVFLGVGINVRTAPLPSSAALAEFRPVNRAQLLARFLWALENWLEQEKERVLCAWRERNVTLGRWVVVATGNEVLEGLAVDLGPQGELLLRTKSGLKAVFSGDVISVGTKEVEDPEVREGETESGGSGHSEGKRPGPSAE